MKANVNHMLVYGTLRQGERANAMMERHATFVETIRLPDAVMFSLGGFPGIRLGDGDGVECDLYRIDNPDLLRGADQYEGYYGPGNGHNLYNRVTVQTPTGIEAFIYEYNGAPSAYPIASGDWKNR